MKDETRHTHQRFTKKQRITHSILAALTGAILLSLLSVWPKTLLNIPFTNPIGHIIPVTVGGIGGFIISLWNRRLQESLIQLRKSREMYRTLIEQASDGIFVADAQGNYIEVNSSGCAMVGYSREEILRLNVSDLVSPEEQTETPVRYEELRAGQTILSQRHLIRKDGSLLPVEISAKQLPDGRLQGIVRDITEREKAAEALRESEERFRRLMQELPIGIELFSPDGTLLDVNKTWEEMWGTRAEDVVGRYNLLKASIYKRMGVMHLLERAFAGEEVELPILECDPAQANQPGRKRWIRARVYNIKDEQGQVKHVVLLSEDITDRKQAEQALLQAQKTESLGILAGGVAHDFNNLLVAMLGQTSLALTKMRAESPARPHITKAVRAAERAADLTRQMLAYSGRGHFEIRPIHLNALIEENLHLFESSLPKNVHLRAHLADSLPAIDADPGQMQQVIMNLILNGAQAIGDAPGTVMVVTGTQLVGEENGRYQLYTGNKLPPGPYVTLEIHDDGKGMDADTLSKIFDPFFTTKETGQGLGLAAVLGIARGHNGGLYVYSEPDKGTTFKLLFPASQDSPIEQTKPDLRRQAKTTTRLALVIDDEKPVLEAVADILELEGIQTLTAASGADGVALYRERMDEISLVLLDLSMPGMDGEETFRKLRQINPGVRIVLSSGYNQVEATRRFTGKRLTAFIQKPYNAATLIEVIKRHMP